MYDCGVGSDALAFGTEQEPLSEGLKPSFLSPMLAPSKPKSSLRGFLLGAPNATALGRVNTSGADQRANWGDSS